MIDLVLYRCRIGGFCGGMGRGKNKVSTKDYSMISSKDLPKYTKFLCFEPSTMHIEENVIYGPEYYTQISILMILYLYIISIFGLVTSSLISSPKFIIPRLLFPGMSYFNCQLSFPAVAHINVAYFYLFFYTLLRFMCSKNCPLKCRSIQKPSRLTRLISNLILALLTLNFLLIGMCNPSMLNQGPNKLKVLHHNVQGLIPFSELGKPQPKLDQTKIYELNTYVNARKPDVIVLNETWVTKAIEDRTIIEDEIYEIFRNDRDKASHPPDLDNPNKYRTNGGGVLIAIRSDLKAEFKRLSVRKGAEIIAAEITMPDDKKLIFCSVYRVGNLGEANHRSIINTIKSFYKIRNPRKIVIVEDMNLIAICWPISDGQSVSNRVEQLFVNSFDELGLQFQKAKLEWP